MASGHAKQSPLGKTERSLAADGKCYFSYAQVAETVSSVVEQVKVRRSSCVRLCATQGVWDVWINIIFLMCFKVSFYVESEFFGCITSLGVVITVWMPFVAVAQGH